MPWHGTNISARDSETLVVSDRPGGAWLIAGFLLLLGVPLLGWGIHGLATGAHPFQWFPRLLGAACAIPAGVFVLGLAPLTRFVFPRKGRSLSVRRFWLRGAETLLLQKSDVVTIAVEEAVDSDGQSWYWIGLRLRTGYVMRMSAQGLPGSSRPALEAVASELRGWWALPKPIALPPLREEPGTILPESARQIVETPSSAPAVAVAS